MSQYVELCIQPVRYRIAHWLHKRASGGGGCRASLKHRHNIGLLHNYLLRLEWDYRVMRAKGRSIIRQLECMYPANPKKGDEG